MLTEGGPGGRSLGCSQDSVCWRAPNIYSTSSQGVSLPAVYSTLSLGMMQHTTSYFTTNVIEMQGLVLKLHTTLLWLAEATLYLTHWRWGRNQEGEERLGTKQTDRISEYPQVEAWANPTVPTPLTRFDADILNKWYVHVCVCIKWQLLNIHWFNRHCSRCFIYIKAFNHYKFLGVGDGLIEFIL